MLFNKFIINIQIKKLSRGKKNLCAYNNLNLYVQVQVIFQEKNPACREMHIKHFVIQ